MAELYANIPETELASAYTAGDPTIEVVDDAARPSGPTFTVALGNDSNTLLRVTAVAGTTWDVEAEEFDDDASSGTTVRHVVSKRGMEALAQAPAATEAVGVVGEDASESVFPMFRCRPLDQSSWTWVNQEGSAVTQSGGLVKFVAANTGGGTDIRLRVKSHSSPKVYEVFLVPLFPTGGFINNICAFGIAFRESGTGEITAIVLSNFDFNSGGAPSPQVVHVNYNSETSHAANVAIVALPSSSPWAMLPLGGVWLRLTDNGTNIITEFSYDRQTWVAVATVSRTSFMAGGPDQVGIFGTSQGGSISTAAWFASWNES